MAGHPVIQQAVFALGHRPFQTNSLSSAELMDPIKQVGFGCVALSTFTTLSAALRILETAYDCGIRHFDTAPVYGNGFSEKVLSVFLKGKRDTVTLATKTGLFIKDDSGLPAWAALPLNAVSKKIRGKAQRSPISFNPPEILQHRPIGKAEVQASIAGSRSRLGTDRLDYLLLHEALPSFLSDEALGYLLSLRSRGEVGKLGIAASALNIAALRADEISDWDVLQYENALQYNSDALVDVFEGKEHIYHSIFKTLLLIKKEKINFAEAPGILLARSYHHNPNGRLLFSTTNADNLRNNLRVYEAYTKYSKAETDQIIADAIS